MKKKKLRLILWLGLTAAVLTFIWGNSMLPATQSSELSSGLLARIAAFLPFLTEHILRKVAHFTEFAALGFCLCRLTVLLEKKPLLSLAGGVGAACVDECIQIFSPGRACRFGDVCIDAAGVLTGMVLILLLVKYSRRRAAAN